MRTQYRTKDNVRCVGVTTVTGEIGWNTRVLMNWANRLGLEGINSATYTDDKAKIGSLAHGLILQHHSGKKFDTTDYSEKQIKQAENSLLSYFEWLKGKTLEPILLETPLVSEIYRYGGTPDNYCVLDGKRTLLDYKTGKGIYLEYYIQVAGGYRQLLLENSYPVAQVLILNIPRTEDESFQFKIIKDVDTCWEIFKRAREIYGLKKRLNG